MIKTVVELDLVGYSTIAENLEQALGVETSPKLNAQIQGFVDQGLNAVGAQRSRTVVATTGDGAILVFDKPSDAHRFAAAVHAATREHNQSKDRPIAKRVFRIGTATGEVVLQTNAGGSPEIAGVTISRAVRLEAKAKPGELLVDTGTYAGLTPAQKKLYGARETILGKRDEKFDAYRCVLDSGGVKDAEFFTGKFEAAEIPKTIAVKSSDRKALKREILRLFKQLKAHQFDDLIFLLDMPIGQRPPNTLPTDQRKTYVLEWSEQEVDGLQTLLGELRELVGLESGQPPVVRPADLTDLPATGETPASKPQTKSPPSASSIRVLVVGSLNRPKPRTERRGFNLACEHLGAALASRGLTIVVSSLHPNTADFYVLKGANGARSGRAPLPVVLLPPTKTRKNDPLYPANETEFRASYPNLQFTLEMLPGNWNEIRKAQVRNADVVVLIGGREGTRQVAWAAKEFGVPIVPIPIFGRAAKHLWDVERAELVAQGRFEECEAFSKLFDKFKAEQIADLVLLLAQRRPTVPSPRQAPAQIAGAASPSSRQPPLQKGASPANKCRILFLAANPEETSPLSLDREMRKIMERIQASERRDSLEMISAWAVRLEDLFDNLNRHHPQVVHFSGHGEANVGIVLHDENDHPRTLNKSDLKGIFEEFKNTVRLVVLNACYTDDQAGAIVDEIDCAVGFKGEVDDVSAIDFAGQFYSALGFERSVQSAFNQAIKLLRGKRNVKAERFVLRARSGVNPDEVFPF